MTTIPKKKRHPQLVLLVLLVFFVISFITNILNSIIVAVKESFDLSLSAAGLLPFSFFIAYAVMSIPAGIMTERFSSRALLSGSFVVIVLSCFSLVMNPNYFFFLLTLFVLGLCMAVLQVIINPMLRMAGGEEHFAFNSVMAQVVFGSASFLSPLLYMRLASTQNQSTLFGIINPWIPSDMPWLSLYVFFAVLAMILLVIIRFIQFPKTEQEPLEAKGVYGYSELLNNPWTYLYFFGIFAYVGFEQGVGNWMAEYLWVYHGFDATSIGASTVSYFWAMLTVGSLVGLGLLRLFDSRTVLVCSSLGAIVCMLLSLFGAGSLAVISFPAIGFMISVMWSIIFSLGLNSMPRHHGAFSGILCTGIAGGAIWPLIVGYAGDLMNLKWAMLLLLIPLGYIFSIGLWSKPLIKNQTIRGRSNK